MEQAGVMCLLLLLLLSLGCLPRGVLGDGNDENNVRINNVDDFKNFVNEVNSGTNYSGTTVLLDSDLSLSEETLEPIGNTSSNYFNGTFDGQGHIISDLKMNSSSGYTGLFGYSDGLTIRNVVLDSSCSITSSFSGSSSVHVGGIIGYCYASNGQCNIENSVNMADVSFNGDTGSSLYLGGIAGYLYSSYGYNAYMKNCANYGSVTHSGTSSSSNIGGIAGYPSGSSSISPCLYNCLNYGTITHSGTTSNTLYLGGIAGYSNYYVYIENCVSAGKISIQTTSSKSSYVGSIVGSVNPGTSINYCYYPSDIAGYPINGTGTPSNSSYTLSYDNTTFKLNGAVSVGSYTGTSLINALNAAADYYFLHDYSKWLLNKEKKSVKFIINSRTSPITVNHQIILLPSLAKEGNISFDGWYNDNKCAHPLESFEITEGKTLYGRFEENTNNYTISFDTRTEGSSVAPITARFGTVVQLPSESIREHCSFAFWENEYGYNVGLSLTMPAHNFTLYAVWKCTQITTPGDFVDFSKVVNSGTNYSGTTVFLDSDLSLSEETLEPIGKDSVNYFFGVFDGQGHIISNLKIKSSSSLQYTGLFGYSAGLTIKNVVLDSSCSITSSYSGLNYVYVGGIIGYCYASKKKCNIENSVNMADVSFSGDISSPSSILGGISGYLYSPSYPVYVKNCANYGSFTHSGTSYYSHIGGIAGYLSGSSSTYIHLYNCLNYGAITHSGTSSDTLDLGGITGYSNYAYIENCVSAGEISLQTTPSYSYVGSIVGYVASSNTSIIYCYYTSDVGGYPINGTGEGTPQSTTGTPTSATTVDSSLVTNLNNHASDNGWNGWLLNKNNASVTFKVNDYAGFTLNSQIILLPTLAVNNSDDGDDGSSFAFSGWYSDPYCQDLFQSDEVTEGTTLYGVYGVVVTVTFDVNGGNELTATSKKVALNRTYGTLPEASRTGHMFVGWFTESNESVTSETIVNTTANHTLHAHWSANNYTVTFDVNGGNELTENKMTVTFNKAYGTLPEASRTGHMFVGWFTENNSLVTNKTTVNTTTNHTLHAHWEEVTNQVEVVFNAKDLSKEDVEEIVKKYVEEGTEFTITEFGTDESGEIRVIITFKDTEKAENFIKTIKEPNDAAKHGIKKIGFVPYDTGSFSCFLYPSLFNIILATF